MDNSSILEETSHEIRASYAVLKTVFNELQPQLNKTPELKKMFELELIRLSSLLEELEKECPIRLEEQVSHAG